MQITYTNGCQGNIIQWTLKMPKHPAQQLADLAAAWPISSQWWLWRQRDPKSTTLDSKREIWLGQSMYAKKYLEKMGCTDCCCSWRNVRGSIDHARTACWRKRCAIICFTIMPAPHLQRARGTCSHKVGSHNYDLIFRQILPGKVNYYSEIKLVLLPADGVNERGYNDQYGTDYYENGDESDYYGIVRHARQKGIPSAIIEHQLLWSSTCCWV